MELLLLAPSPVWPLPLLIWAQNFKKKITDFDYITASFLKRISNNFFRSLSFKST